MTEIVLFGITGDLAKQKLIPALFNIYLRRDISSRSSFIGFGRKDFKKEEFHNFIEQCIKEKIPTFYSENQDKVQSFCSQWSYIQSELDSDDGYTRLAQKLSDKDGTTTLVYISLPPVFQLPITKKLVEHGIISKKGGLSKRLAFEKPFGFDSESAQKLQKYIDRNLLKQQVLRVDHYAGKQALIELENTSKQGVFNNIFSRKNVSKIEVRFNEINDVSKRGAFYDSVGALNDVFQNHMVHMIAVILALPISTTSKATLSDVRASLLKTLTVKGIPKMGQYKGYKNIMGVNPESCTETKFDISLQTSESIWRGVKIQALGGKKLPKADSSITVYGKGSAKNIRKSTDNVLFKINVNGYGDKDAYEQVFVDAIDLNPDRFVSFEQSMQGWRIVEKVKRLTKGKKLEVY